jgi:phosphatidylserine synthase
MVLDIFGLVFGAALVVLGGVGLSRATTDKEKYFSGSSIVIGALFIVLAVLLLAGVHI